MSVNYERSIWQVDAGGETFELEALGDVIWNPPDELQNVSILKAAGGRGVKFDSFPDANVSSFTINVVQETREEGIMWRLAHASGSIEFSYGRINNDAADDGEVVRFYSPRAQVRFAGSPTWADNAQVFPYTITCIGYNVDFKNAESIERL